MFASLSRWPIARQLIFVRFFGTHLIVQSMADRVALAMAERTRLSSQAISSTVTAVLEESKRAVQRMQAVSTNMRGSVDLVRAAGQSL